jgi:hypothetical protein
MNLRNLCHLWLLPGCPSTQYSASVQGSLFDVQRPMLGLPHSMLTAFYEVKACGWFEFSKVVVPGTRLQSGCAVIDALSERLAFHQPEAGAAVG